jgi:Iron-sulfur cluster assembly protein
MSLGADPAVLDRVYAALQEVIDPELGLDVVALGRPPASTRRPVPAIDAAAATSTAWPGSAPTSRRP